MKTLLLMRHARAEHGASSDKQRPLTAEGMSAARAAGARLVDLDQVPDRVLVSSAIRTQQTCARVLSAFDTDPDVEVLDDLYRTDSLEMIDIIRAQAGDADTVLVVGHEPTISSTASILIREDADPGLTTRLKVGMSVASIAVLRFEGEWSDLAIHECQLLDILKQ